MSEHDRDKEYSPNPPIVIGKPVRQPSFGELAAIRAAHGTYHAFLVETGYYFTHGSPADPKEKDRGRER
jgi:hypothetical protein